jgi:cytochrome c
MSQMGYLTTAGITAALVAFCCGTLLAQQNNRPIVKITSPLAGRTYPVNTLIPYSVIVTDKEDGDSNYGEINRSEVYLSVRRIPDPARSVDAAEPDPPGFVLLQKANCSGCHLFNKPWIGPSYAEITRRYPFSKDNEIKLAKRVIQGSTGGWGTGVMPTNPALSTEEAGQIIAWILTHADDPDTNYYSGTEGVIRLTVPDSINPGGIYLIRASYTDHGIKVLEGMDALVIYGK